MLCHKIGLARAMVRRNIATEASATYPLAGSQTFRLPAIPHCSQPKDTASSGRNHQDLEDKGGGENLY